MASVGSERRDELLDQLVELFLAEGFRQFTLGDLAARLRCSKTTLYALGVSKEQLTGNAVRHFFRRATAFVEERTAAEQDAAARIVAYLSAVADALRPASATFMADLAEHPVATQVYEQNTAAAAERVRRLIAEGVEGGEFRAVHAEFVGDVVASTMTRIQTGAVLANTGLHDSEAYEELAALVLGGVRR